MKKLIVSYSEGSEFDDSGRVISASEGSKSERGFSASGDSSALKTSAKSV